MVLSLCAIVRTVQSANSVRIVFCIFMSVLWSTLEVASSRRSILVFLSKARAKQINCLCPTLFCVNDLSFSFDYSCFIIKNGKLELTLSCRHLRYTRKIAFLANFAQTLWDALSPMLSITRNRWRPQKGLYWSSMCH